MRCQKKRDVSDNQVRMSGIKRERAEGCQKNAASPHKWVGLTNNAVNVHVALVCVSIVSARLVMLVGK